MFFILFNSVNGVLMASYCISDPNLDQKLSEYNKKKYHYNNNNNSNNNNSNKNKKENNSKESKREKVFQYLYY